MTKIVGWLIVVVVGIVMSVNACYMTVSPRAWFRLPRWIRAAGSLTAEQYSAGWGAIQVRAAGAITIAAIGWVVFQLFFGRR